MTIAGEIVSNITGTEVKVRPMEFLMAKNPALKGMAIGEISISDQSQFIAARTALLDFVSGVRDYCRQSSLIHPAAMEFDGIMDELKKAEHHKDLIQQAQKAGAVLELYSNMAQASVGRAFMNGLKSVGEVSASIDLGEMNDKAVLTWLEEQGIESAARDTRKRQIYQNLLDYTQLNEQDLLQGVHFFFDDKTGIEALGISYIRKGDENTVVRLRPNGLKGLLGGSLFAGSVQALTFKDDGQGVKHFGPASKEALSLMVAYAQKHGWTSVNLSGPPENAAELTRIYHAFVAAGISVEGFKPSFPGDNPFLKSTSLTMTGGDLVLPDEAIADESIPEEGASREHQEAFDRLYESEVATESTSPAGVVDDEEANRSPEEIPRGFSL